MTDDPPIGEEAFRAMFLKHRDGRRDAFSLWAELVRKNWTEKQLHARFDVGARSEPLPWDAHAEHSQKGDNRRAGAALPTKEAKR